MSSDYLDLMKQVLTGFIFPESSDQPIRLRPGSSLKTVAINSVVKIAASQGIRLMKAGKFNAELRTEGRDWPSIAYTMVGLKRLSNVQHAIETALIENIPGDICECGVWRGGCSIFMRAVLKEHKVTDRRVWAADSFEGLPPPDVVKYPDDKAFDLSENEYLSASLDQVTSNFQRFGLLDEQVRFLRGWFRDTLPAAPIDKLAVLRADGDLYESTMDILSNLYGKVSPGGFVIIDDYHSWEPCRRAVAKFRLDHDITAPIETIDWTGAFWRIPKSNSPVD